MMVAAVINDWWLVLKHNTAEHAVSYFFDMDFLNNDFFIELQVVFRSKSKVLHLTYDIYRV